jgi:hypothetical protein
VLPARASPVRELQVQLELAVTAAPVVTAGAERLAAVVSRGEATVDRRAQTARPAAEVAGSAHVAAVVAADMAAVAAV